MQPRWRRWWTRLLLVAELMQDIARRVRHGPESRQGEEGFLEERIEHVERLYQAMQQEFRGRLTEARRGMRENKRELQALFEALRRSRESGAKRIAAVEALGQDTNQVLERRVAALEETYRHLQTQINEFEALDERGLSGEHSLEEELAYLVMAVEELERRFRWLDDTLGRVRERVGHVRRQIETAEAQAPPLPPHQRPGHRPGKRP